MRLKIFFASVLVSGYINSSFAEEGLLPLTARVSLETINSYRNYSELFEDFKSLGIANGREISKIEKYLTRNNFDLKAPIFMPNFSKNQLSWGKIILKVDPNDGGLKSKFGVALKKKQYETVDEMFFRFLKIVEQQEPTKAAKFQILIPSTWAADMSGQEKIGAALYGTFVWLEEGAYTIGFCSAAAVFSAAPLAGNIVRLAWSLPRKAIFNGDVTCENGDYVLKKVEYHAFDLYQATMAEMERRPKSPDLNKATACFTSIGVGLVGAWRNAFRPSSTGCGKDVDTATYKDKTSCYIKISEEELKKIFGATVPKCESDSGNKRKVQDHIAEKTKALRRSMREGFAAMKNLKIDEKTLTEESAAAK